MKKIYNITIVTALVIAGFTSASEAKQDELFTPCQYKNSYKFYMEKGDTYMADGQLASALDSYKKALMVQPDSAEARLKIVTIKETISAKKKPNIRNAAVNQTPSRADLKAKEMIAPKQAAVPKKTIPAKNKAIYDEPDYYVQAVPKESSAEPEPVISKRKIIAKESEPTPAANVKEPEYTPGASVKEPEYAPAPVTNTKIKPKAMPARISEQELTEKQKYQKQVYGEAYYPEVDEQLITAQPVAKEPVVKEDYEALTEPVIQDTYTPESEAPALIPPAAPEVSDEILPEQSKEIITAQRPKNFDEAYDEYLHPIRFNNGINDKIQAGANNINSNIAPAKVSGEYRLAFGITPEDFIWKDANADYHNMPGDTSWRYIFGQDRQNSYDKKIYSRLKVDADVPITDIISGYGEMVVDPWTFVGKKRVYVTGSNGDNVQMDLKYWSNVRRTINETYRTERGDIVSIAENKVQHDKTSPETFTGLSDWGPNRFDLGEVEIDRMYVPIRKLWVEYGDEPYHAKVFAMAYQDEALSSDDPMQLSNNKVWWEESPWIDTYEPSRVFERAGSSGPVGFNGLKEPLKKGQWVRNQSFIARDSNDQRLTFLRGGSFDASFDNGTSVKMVAASPRNLWDSYEQATSLPAAVRVKTPCVAENLTLGALYTFKGGFRHQSLEAINNMVALDASYKLLPNVELIAEGAVSRMNVDEASGYHNDYTGYAGKVGFKTESNVKTKENVNDRYEFEAAFTHMDENFFPGLSNYRFTRNDFEFAKHIYFDELNPKNNEIKVGNGADVGRNSFNLTAKAELPNQNIDTTFDFRTVHSDGWDFIENVFRLDTGYKATSKLTLKGLAYYKYLPKTKKGVDPLMNAKSSYSAFTDYFAYDDEWLQNTAVEENKDPSIGAFSAGLKYDFTDYFSGSGVFEMTNDPKDWPRGLLNNAYVTDDYKDGIIWDKVVPFLYDQSPFGLPPYAYYGIYRASFDYYPFKPFKVTLNYVYNENKYAMAVDGNSTHQGIELEYKPNNRLTMGFLYQYTRQRDMYKEFVLDQGTHYDGHHNIFAALDYDLNNDQHLTIMFGEYVGYNYIYEEEHNSLTALDTRHIVRVVYSGDWGAPYGKEDKKLSDALNPLGPFNPAIPGIKFITNIYGGYAKYEETGEIAPVKSDWDDAYGKLEFGLDAFDKEYWEGSLRVGLFTTLVDKEKWTYEGVGDYQTDDMSIAGADVNFNIGWAISDASKYISLTPLVNVGYRRMEFKRSDIKTSPITVSRIGETDQTFNVSYLGVGGRLDLVCATRFNIYGSGYWAPLVYAPLSNTAVGNFVCNKGNIYHAESGIDYDISDSLEVGVGGYWDLQHLDRSESINSGVVTAEMPDNKFESYGLRLGGLYKF